MGETEPRAGDLPAGDIQFYDHYLASLPPGNYQIDVEHDVAGDPAQQTAAVKPQPFKQSFHRQQRFSVDGARFALDPADIHAVFPPANSQGLYERTLPHIVLTRRALPWERTLQTGQPELPWMALLLFDAAEIIAPDLSGADGAASGLTRDQTLTVRQLNSPAAGVFRPTLALQSYEDPDKLKCRVIDIAPATFTAVVPRLAEIKYLAHCREVNTGDKVILNLDEQGWFSVVVGNRLPDPATSGKNGAGGTPGNLNIAHLVSLEGFADYLVDAPHFPDGTARVRLISLASWVFTCLLGQGQSFAELARGLVAANSQMDTSLLLKLPPLPGSADAQPTRGHKIAAAALDAGYVPLSYQTRQGEQTFAWYRGPLAPVVTERFADRQPFDTADEAIIYDATTGLFDQSYGVAWQIGRLLALADRSFGVNLLAWRRAAHQVVDLLLERLKSENLSTLLDDPDAVAELNTLIEPRLINQQFLNYLLDDFAQNLAPVVSAPGTSQPPRTSARPALSAPAVTPTVIAELQRLLDDPQVQALLQTLSDPRDNPTMEQIVLWLARLVLLNGVPFEHLVPDARMLPPESIRFFYLDQNWLDCLVDGALSLGVHSSRDNLHDRILRPTLNDAVDDAVLQERDRLLGLPLSTGSNALGSMAGFLLRSALVAGWPGLEVRAYRQTDGKSGGEPIKPLRIERLAPNVLLCLFPEVPAWVELDEPQEGFHFGIEDDDMIELRYPAGANAGKLNGRKVAALKRGSSLTLDVAKIQASMRQALADQLGSAGNLGPGDFALQMVAAPEQMVFQNPQ
jgi:hypothetical protein